MVGPQLLELVMGVRILLPELVHFLEVDHFAIPLFRSGWQVETIRLYTRSADEFYRETCNQEHEKTGNSAHEAKTVCWPIQP